MTSSEDDILARIRTDYSRDWTIGRTYLGDNRGRCGSWKATRRRQLTDRQMEKGLDQTLIADTPGDLRQQLAKQADIQGRLADSNPAYR